MSFARGGGARGRARGSGSTTPRGAGNTRGRSTPIKNNVSTATSPFAQNGTRALRGAVHPPTSTTAGVVSSRSQSTENWQARHTALTKARERERSDAIRRGIIADPDKPRLLSDAVTLRGTCQDMCAEYERVQRVVQRDVWPEERVAHRSPYASGEHEPDEARMVKKFRRAAAGIEEQLPSDLRPPSVLRKTCDYLFDEVIRDAESLASVHHFVWDRTRAVRNDFSIQQLSKSEDLRIAVHCYERIARFHIVSLHLLAGGPQPYAAYDSQQEREQLDRTLLSLLQYYDDCRGRIEITNEAEFRAYSILFQMQDPFPDMEDRVQRWPLHILRDPRVQISLELFAAVSNAADPQGPLKPRAPQSIAQQDWEHFWVLIASKRVSFLMGCVAEVYFNLVRRTVLNALWRAFRGNPRVADQYWTPSVLTEMFAFDSEDDAQQFCTSYGFSFRDRQDGDGQYLDLTSVRDRELPPPDKTLPSRLFSTLVEDKRLGRSISAIIDGMNVREAQEAGLVVAEEDRDEMEMATSTAEGGEDGLDNDSENSLFIPQSTPSAFSAAKKTAISDVHSSDTLTSNNSPFASKPTFGTVSQPAAPSAFSFGQPSQESQDLETTAPSSTSIFAQTKPKLPGASPFGASTPNPFSSFAQPKDSGTNFETAKSTMPTFSWSKPVDTTSSSTISATTIPAPAQTFGQSLFSTVPSPSTSATNGNTAASIAPKLPSFTPSTFSFGNNVNTADSDSSQKAPALPTFSSTPFSFTKTSSTDKPASSTFQATNASNSTFGFTNTATAATPNPDLFKSGNTSQETVKESSQATNFGQKSPTSFSFDRQPSPDSDTASTKDKAIGVPAITTSSNTNQSQSARKASLSQDTRPKKPSPLSHSFSAEDSSGHPFGISAGDVPTNVRAEKPEIKASEVFKGMQDARANEAQKSMARDVQRRASLIDRITQEITFADRWGFMDQYLEFHIGKVITSVQTELYMQKIAEEADEFRQSVLSRRYALRWREIYRHKKHARQGRLRRERALQSLRESKLAPEDRHRSSRRRSAISSPSLQPNDPIKHRETVDRMFQQTVRSSRASSVASSVQQALCPPAHRDNRPTTTATPTVKRYDHVDDRGRISKPGSTGSSTDQLNRSAFLSFALPFDAPNRTSTTYTNYFRLKAMGISTESANSRGAKRQRTSSIGSANDATPPSAKRLTLPSSSPALSVPLEHCEANSKTMTTNEEDEALFARLRAAREGLNEAASFLRSEVAKRSSGSPPGVKSASPFSESPSMARMRSEVRRSASHLVTADSLSSSTRDVPAYRLRESRFVPREQYGKAIERSQNIRAARSVQVSSSSHHTGDGRPGASIPLALHDFGSLTNGAHSSGLLTTLQANYQESLPRASQNDEGGQSPVVSSLWHAQEVPVVPQLQDIPSASHVELPQDFSIAPNEVDSSLAASFGPNSIHQAASWSAPSQDSVFAPQAHAYLSTGDNIPTFRPNKKIVSQEEVRLYNPDREEEETANDSFAHANPFAALATQGEEDDDDDDASEEASEGFDDGADEDGDIDGPSDFDEEGDYSRDSQDEVGEEYEDEDEVEDGDLQSGDEDEDELDEDEEEEHYMDPRIAASSGWQPHFAQRATEEAVGQGGVGGTEDDAIELSD